MSLITQLKLVSGMTLLIIKKGNLYADKTMLADAVRHQSKSNQIQADRQDSALQMSKPCNTWLATTVFQHAITYARFWQKAKSSSRSQTDRYRSYISVQIYPDPGAFICIGTDALQPCFHLVVAM